LESFALSSPPSGDRRVKEKTRLRVIAALLLASPLSWTVLLERTGLSKNALSATLKDLKASGQLSYSFSESNQEVRPSVSYLLTESARKKYTKVTEALEDLKHIQDLADKVTKKYRGKAPKSEPKKIFSRYYTLMVDAGLASLETAILAWSETGDEVLDEAVSSTAISIARGVLLLQDLPREITSGIRNDLMDERSRLIKLLEKEVAD
jgi:DNA-binding MarR family transcriptional regulator